MKIYDSRDPAYKNPFGAVKANERVSFTIKLPKSFAVETVSLRICEIDSRDASKLIPMRFCSAAMSENSFYCEYAVKTPAIYTYSFEFTANGRTHGINRLNDNSAVVDNSDGLWQLTVYDENMSAPAFLREGVMYQIFPDRFFNSGENKTNIPGDRILHSDWSEIPDWRPNRAGEILNNDYFCGDLKGIEQKLDYIASLGVTSIYLNPIFEAHSNHRYNTADYSKIDPMLGTNDDFKNLARTAKEKGISIILDGVFSHTGSDSIYFDKNGRYGGGGAYSDENSPYRAWYSFSKYPEKYECWWDFDTLPNVNETCESYMEYICGENGILRQWLDAGASGFRLDVADELPNAFLDVLAARVKSYSMEAAVLGEVWEDASNKSSHGGRRRYLLGGQLDSVMNYPFREAILSYIRHGGSKEFLGAVMQILENYPKPAIQALMNSLSTHDTERAITMLAAEPLSGRGRKWQAKHHNLTGDAYSRGVSLFKLACILQFGLPGIPCVYYGDEAGLSGYRDPFNRCCYPWGHENRELLDFIVSLGRVRRDYPIFAEAEFVPLMFSDELCSFARINGGTGIIFAVNRCYGAVRLELPEHLGVSEVLTSCGEYRDGILMPLSGVVLLSKASAGHQ